MDTEDIDYEKYVRCTSDGYPVCWMDDELCDVKRCKYYINYFDLGNCVLRVRRQYTLLEVSIAFGISRERIRQIEARAMQKLKKRHGARLLKLLSIDT